MKFDVIKDVNLERNLNLSESLYNDDVLNCLAVLNVDDNLTKEVINKVLDLFSSDLWSNPNIKLLDNSCKSQIFVIEVIKRLDKGLESQIPDKKTRINHILKNQIATQSCNVGFDVLIDKGNL
ncbi:DNA methyltransferase [Moraxella bovis]|uniref:DNA methyltransferase n=1 Tax=Moraxella bovis TaxID=476 RepID=UPI00222766D0|nr:DNA methyltransferase [Moraxella bovis]UYZ89677.1 DNA methyltransferase [Moraxella bovis]UYZ95228.1 DNA methyltransferase [Moraxella bovis]